MPVKDHICAQNVLIKFACDILSFHGDGVVCALIMRGLSRWSVSK